MSDSVVRTCRLCGEDRLHRGRGLCRRCYQRAEREGRLGEFPRIERQGRKPHPREHGTRKGYDQHYRRGEPPCEECREGMRRWAREQAATERYRKYQRAYQPRWKRMRKTGMTGKLSCERCGHKLGMHGLDRACPTF